MSEIKNTDNCKVIKVVTGAVPFVQETGQSIREGVLAGSYEIHQNKNQQVSVAVVHNDPAMGIYYVLRRLRSNDPGESFSDYITDLLSLEELLLPEKNVGRVTCYAPDEYSSEEGKRAALKKADKNAWNSFRKAITRWQATMLRKIFLVSPKTFGDAYNSFVKWEASCAAQKKF